MPLLNIFKELQVSQLFKESIMSSWLSVIPSIGLKFANSGSDFREVFGFLLVVAICTFAFLMGRFLDFGKL